MNDDNKAFNIIKNTKDYVSCLLNKHFEELYQAYLDLLYKNFPDVLQKHKSNNSKSIVQKSYLKQVLTLVKNDSDLNQLHQFINNQFSADYSENISINSKLLFSTIRQLLIKFLSVYTNDFRLYSSIVNEFEEYFQLLERIHDREAKILHLHNDFLYSIINNSLDGIAAFDKELRVIEWNWVLEHHHKIKKADIIGRKIYEALPDYSDSEEVKASEKVLSGEKVFLSNLPYKTKEYGWYDAYMAPIYDDGRVNAILCIFRDITKRKENEDKYREQRRKLEIANKELKEQREEVKASNEELQESLKKLTVTQAALKENEARLNEAQAVANLGS